MASYLREASPARTCWNCDRAATDTVAVTVRAPSGHESTLTLCRPCYANVYLPLAATAPERGATSDVGEGAVSAIH